jgi:hypothetical protein
MDGNPFLRSSAVVDWHHPAILETARSLSAGRRAAADVAQSCFEWVRDRIAHAGDHRVDRMTASASEVVSLGAGFCFAKSHLLAALLRANTIPAGFVYQRLACDDERHGLHGLNAVWLPDVGWYRIDARGARADLAEARFDPPRESLPYDAAGRGEILFPGVWAEPLPSVVDALRRAADAAAFLAMLPDALDLGEPDALIDATPGRRG